MRSFEIVSLNVSEKKGTVKLPVARIVCKEDWGVVGDAHAGPGIRQISLLAAEDIESMGAKGADLKHGDFAENITTRAIELSSLPVGTRLRIGAVLLEITQIGKECHSGCAIMKTVGSCIMPKKGVFARVVEGGEITREDTGTYDL